MEEVSCPTIVLTGHRGIAQTFPIWRRRENRFLTQIRRDDLFISATPNLSGRDTPSSHISLDSSDRRTTSTNNAHSHAHDGASHNHSSSANNNHNSLNASTQRGPILPVVVQKPFREDVSDKFNLFDLPQQRSNAEGGKLPRSNHRLIGTLNGFFCSCRRRDPIYHL